MKKTKWVCKEPHLLGKDDSRISSFKKQLKRDGFCDSETWSLDTTIVEFTLPRLERFYEIAVGGGSNDTKFHKELKKIIKAFRIIMSEEGYPMGDDHKKVVDKGMKLFHKNFFSLWW